MALTPMDAQKRHDIVHIPHLCGISCTRSPRHDTIDNDHFLVAEAYYADAPTFARVKNHQEKRKGVAEA